MSWRRLDPSPFRSWIGWAPRRWPAIERPRLDLAARRIVWPEVAPGEEPLPQQPPDEPEAVYLPPVPEHAAGARDVLAQRLTAAGCAVVRHDIAAPSSPHEDAGERWLDLLAPLLAGRAAVGGVRAAGRWGAVLPLLPGLPARAEELDELLDAWRAGGCFAVLGLAPELAPADRRRLVEQLGEDWFETVFHGRTLGEAELARAAAGRGLLALPEPPPVPGLTPRRARDRELAAALAECGELALRLGRPEGEAAALLAASRHLRAEPRDLAALAREGNLEVVEWLPEIARRVVAEELAGREYGLRAELRAAWTGRVR